MSCIRRKNHCSPLLPQSEVYRCLYSSSLCLTCCVFSSVDQASQYAPFSIYRYLVKKPDSPCLCKFNIGYTFTELSTLTAGRFVIETFMCIIHQKINNITSLYCIWMYGLYKHNISFLDDHTFSSIIQTLVSHHLILDSFRFKLFMCCLI